MIRRLALLALIGAAPIASNPSLGTAEGRCRPNEQGPAILISPLGLKDRTGTLRAELFPPDQADFLADDNVLVAAHKTFRRVTIPLPPKGPVSLCIRVPSPGVYTLALTHDRAGKPKFDFWRDGVGFPGNPAIGHAAPPAAEARILAGPGLTRTAIILNYRRGILGFGPLG
ncbi:DUF2141 domain-containing protein [Sphingomonas oligoaromativorans]|uniref:DUF2141 domain-containing protein n=1 Tax=Sphingomonas oligoaromativorans TaxID=575322 RepID=UPI00142275FC|nr:DUF2141 domain-containing protein [Sphingomonas oligoaromativorans]NIJ34201.1 uncharacterized protein (DUF2141 family) [Sphingomonas oligoaromativorans]